MIYDPAKFEAGEAVRIADRPTLEGFMASWKFHHPLQSEQLAHAGKSATVVRSMMYHGGDVLYELDHVPGIWHEQLLARV